MSMPKESIRSETVQEMSPGSIKEPPGLNDTHATSVNNSTLLRNSPEIRSPKKSTNNSVLNKRAARQIKMLEKDLEMKDKQMQELTEMMQKEKEKLVRQVEDLKRELELALIKIEQLTESKADELENLRRIHDYEMRDMEDRMKDQERIYNQEIRLKETIIDRLNLKIRELFKEIE